MQQRQPRLGDVVDDYCPRERRVTWLEPRLVAQVGFMERTGDGRLRHPVFLGLRDDKAPAEVRWSAQTA